MAHRPAVGLKHIRRLIRTQLPPQMLSVTRSLTVLRCSKAQIPELEYDVPAQATSWFTVLQIVTEIGHTSTRSSSWRAAISGASPPWAKVHRIIVGV